MFVSRPSHHMLLPDIDLGAMAQRPMYALARVHAPPTGMLKAGRHMWRRLSSSGCSSLRAVQCPNGKAHEHQGAAP